MLNDNTEAAIQSPMTSIKRIFKMFTLRLAVFSSGLAVDTQFADNVDLLNTSDRSFNFKAHPK